MNFDLIRKNIVYLVKQVVLINVPPIFGVKWNFFLILPLILNVLK